MTPFEPEQMHAGGDFLAPGARGGGLPSWTAGDRSLIDSDIVLWYVMGTTHQVRPEDYPIMPVRSIGFSIEPFGFFNENPALNVEP